VALGEIGLRACQADISSEKKADDAAIDGLDVAVGASLHRFPGLCDVVASVGASAVLPIPGRQAMNDLSRRFAARHLWGVEVLHPVAMPRERPSRW